MSKKISVGFYMLLGQLIWKKFGNKNKRIEFFQPSLLTFCKSRYTLLSIRYACAYYLTHSFLRRLLRKVTPDLNKIV